MTNVVIQLLPERRVTTVIGFRSLCRLNGRCRHTEQDYSNAKRRAVAINEAGDGKRQAGANPALGGIFSAFVGIIPAIRTAVDIVDIFEARVESFIYLDGEADKQKTAHKAAR